MSNKRKSRRGEVYDSWINSFGFGTILFFIFVGFGWQLWRGGFNGMGNYCIARGCDYWQCILDNHLARIETLLLEKRK